MSKPIKHTGNLWKDLRQTGVGTKGSRAKGLLCTNPREHASHLWLDAGDAAVVLPPSRHRKTKEGRTRGGGAASVKCRGTPVHLGITGHCRYFAVLP
jgi:hypothetical protein